MFVVNRSYRKREFIYGMAMHPGTTLIGKWLSIHIYFAKLVCFMQFLLIYSIFSISVLAWQTGKRVTWDPYMGSSGGTLVLGSWILFFESLCGGLYFSRVRILFSQGSFSPVLTYCSYILQLY